MSNRTGFPKTFNKNKFIFIHVPKAAGTSLKTALNLSFRDAGHLPLTYYEHLHPEEYREFYKFAFVRNPWSRLLSAYNYMSQRIPQTTLSGLSLLPN
ncbi:MAG: sulfotransferase family 2 domain-containing protein [Methylophaga sp.]|nr:sulfotransferase family 2 domain-containing protein [Methylophaga sp.]